MREARPTHAKILLVAGVLSLVSCLGGIVAIIWSAFARTEMSMFGVEVTTGHVGVAFVALGVVSMLFVSRSVLKNLAELAKVKRQD